jgi:hypothetical protein
MKKVFNVSLLKVDTGNMKAKNVMESMLSDVKYTEPIFEGMSSIFDGREEAPKT